MASASESARAAPPVKRTSTSKGKSRANASKVPRVSDAISEEEDPEAMQEFA